MQKISLATPAQDCTGCGACRSACPVDAISMELNSQGFYAPVVNESLCIGCGKCNKACPVDKDSPNRRIASFYGAHKDDETLYRSTSGGVFRALADRTLEEDGIVYGAAYNEDYTQVFLCGSDSCDVSKFQKSKYIVSNAGTVYRQVKEQLETGRKVLFSGAPCQVAGLICYLGKDYENLITVDFVCGGMPSLRFWQEHLKMLEAKYGAAVSNVDFRSKRKGWGKGYLEITFQNGKRYFTREYLDSYFNCFYAERASVRNSCLRCPFHDQHFADITIADFWGYRAVGLTQVEKGVSLMVTNSEKGAKSLQQADTLVLQQMENRYSDYALRKSAPGAAELCKQQKFFEQAEKTNFETAAKRLHPATTFAHIKKYVKLKLGMK